MGIWKQVTSQVGGIFQQAAKQILQEPLELGQSVVQQVTGDNGTGEKGKSSQQSQPPIAQGDPNGGFSNPADLARYEQLSGRKDEIELAHIRSKLHGEFGIETNVDAGMQRARMEFEQKEEQRNKVEEQKKEQEKWVIEKKKEENYAVMAAKAQASGENKAWGAG